MPVRAAAWYAWIIRRYVGFPYTTLTTTAASVNPSPLVLAVRPRRFSRTRAATSDRRRATCPRFGTPSGRAPWRPCRLAPVDCHADRDRSDAERHCRAGDTLESLRLGSDDNEC